MSDLNRPQVPDAVPTPRTSAEGGNRSAVLKALAQSVSALGLALNLVACEPDKCATDGTGGADTASQMDTGDTGPEGCHTGVQETGDTAQDTGAEGCDTGSEGCEGCEGCAA